MQKNSRPPYFPLIIDINEKEILIVGGGKVASRRAKTLLTCGAKITAVSPEFIPDFPDNTAKIKRKFSETDIDEKFLLVIAATNDREVNDRVKNISRAKKIPVNVCDCQSDCDFFFPALINCDGVAVCVNSAGTDSKLTRRLADRLRNVWCSWVGELSSML
ncbi:MAG: bifunctional precorrin-2 dehydrogenase/sirohydrochlorin ferrochelatase [Synergistaceae bacterium]|nr:bifunctional precorrin-2 dehydrogenase/sirohydrochlorin ferrochelatase [Synergistaceae bacterium]